MRQNQEEIIRKEATLEQLCIATIRNILKDTRIKLEMAHEKHHDGTLTLHGPSGPLAFAVESKARVTTTTIRPLIAQIKQHNAPRYLLMSEYISPAVGAILRDADINFADAAGNAHLHAPPLFVWQQGMKAQTSEHRTQRLFQVAGLKLLSVLLWEPHAANDTYRDLAKQAGISPGAIVPIFEDLETGGFLIRAKNQRRLKRLRELLESWVIEYAGSLFPRVVLKTCRLAQEEQFQSITEILQGISPAKTILIGGELAAGIVTAYLRPTRATLYLAPEDQLTWMKRFKLIPDPAGNVDLVQRFGPGNQWADPPAALMGVPCATPVLLYAELLRGGADARLRETADQLLGKFILPRFGENQ